MSILSTEKVSHSFYDRPLFEDLHFALQKGDRIALVGINGTGKSTLLKILSGQLQPNKGIVVSEKDIRIGYLSQEPSFDGLKTVNDFIYSADNEMQQLIKQYDELTHTENPDINLLSKLTDELTEMEAWEYEYEIKSILNRLHITDFDQEIDKLSGGQKKRLSLAKLLIDEPDIYILDEPTNHLDIETIEWLENLFTTGNKTILVVSHDRYFLDSICTEIRELNRGQVYNYKGNYAYFLEKKSERESNQIASAEKAKNLWRKELEWMRRQPKARGTKSKSRIESFYDLEERSKKIKKQEKVQLSVKIARQGTKILEIKNLNHSFGSKTVIKDFDYTFKKGDRIGLAGKNGSGKSTFLNLITQQINPTNDSIQVGEATKFGYYKQQGLSFKNNERVIDVVKNVADYIEMANGETLTASQLLTLFLFPPSTQFGQVSKLSGGEKKRLQLMRVLMSNPNFLILDEPSNDLDIDTLNVLEDFLENYSGVLILVSHDRYLIDKLTDQLFIFSEKGNISIYNGNYADFKSEEDERILKEKQTIQKPKSIVKKEVIKKTPSYKDQIEFENLGREIETLESEILLLTEKLSKTSDHIELQDVAKEIELKKKSLDEKSDRWLELG